MVIGALQKLVVVVAEIVVRRKGVVVEVAEFVVAYSVDVVVVVENVCECGGVV